ncbi:Gfo/Idh/MocA family oxidoreductase [Paenibacillus tritici]|uniref:Gfo/Idh/MocA family oxidoreductase n=1 Tax=Paenibacillus tritici TaxID=1873425 RepID=A0ABX2DM16_9BACL|nr:Gfo/Idh/MocA family oxidoreductase [Paenibacillus tritici]NQX45124.1 Gfo/Idh/MocA family oxidoreductase [Paenibacillus tritici]
MKTEGEQPVYKLGILGASNIAVPAMLEPARAVKKISITAIANRTAYKAAAMAEAYQIPYVAGSLDELLGLGDLDGVYIALSNELHAEWAIRALQAGKHVLVEKPMCLHPEEAERLRLVKQSYADLKLAEGLMIAFHPWQQALKSIVDSGEFGALHRISTRISVPAKNRHAGNYRSVQAKGGGAFADLGCYWLQFVQTLAGLQPSRIRAQSAFDGPDGCDWTFQAALDYENGLKAECLTSFELPFRACHTLYFDQTVLTVPDFFRPVKGFYKIKIRHDLPDNRSTLCEFEPMNYYVSQLEAFAEMMSGQRADNLEASWERVRLQALILAEARQQRVYEANYL